MLSFPAEKKLRALKAIFSRRKNCGRGEKKMRQQSHSLEKFMFKYICLSHSTSSSSGASREKKVFNIELQPKAENEKKNGEEKSLRSCFVNFLCTRLPLDNVNFCIMKIPCSS